MRRARFRIGTLMRLVIVAAQMCWMTPVIFFARPQTMSGWFILNWLLMLALFCQIVFTIW